MATQLDTLASFLPTIGVLHANGGLHAEEHARLTECGVLFADIAGFTPLAERMAARGPEGAEALTHCLNQVFGQLTDLVRRHGGDTLKFAGDALLAIWRSSGERLPVLTLRAASCALEIPAALERAALPEGMRLEFKLAIGAGTVRVAPLGGLFDRWELFVAGDPLAQVARASDRSDPGSVVLSEAAHAHVRDRVEARASENGWVLERVLGHVPCASPPEVPLLPETEGWLRSLVPGAIRARLDAGLSEWIAELRQLTVLFVWLPDLHADVTLERAQCAIETIQTALYRYEGSLNKINVDDKGVAVLAALGLPPLYHADDPARGVRAALDIERELARHGLRTAIGVTTGRVFCGAVGGARRREYTIMGDTVNLAARLMMAAQDGIRCDHETAQQAGLRQSFEALEPIRVKGKAEPVHLYRPLEASRPESERVRAELLALVGREAEQTRLEQRLDRLEQEAPGAAGCLLIHARAGMGKSALLATATAGARRRGLRTLCSWADALERGTPYYAWRAILTPLLEIDPAEPLQARRDALLRCMTEADLKDDLAPLLAPLLPLGEWENESTRTLEARERATRTCELVCALLRAKASPRPVLIVLEDIHWLDSASWSLLRAVGALDRTLLLLSARLEETGGREEIAVLRDTVPLEEVGLAELSPSAVQEIACQRLGVRGLPPALATAFAERAEGNPLFAEELAWALRDSGTLIIEGDTCRLRRTADERGGDLPPTLQAALTQRIDQLGASEQLALKVASVIGVEFSIEHLQEIYPVAVDTRSLEAHCAALQARDLIAHTPGTDPEQSAGTAGFRFRSRVAHEVTYQLMLFAQRRTLHRRLAEWYESRHDLETPPTVLARHWRAAADGPDRDPELVRKAVGHLEAAAVQAAYSYANHDAIRLYDEALELLGWLEDSAAHRRHELALRLALGVPLVSATSWAADEVFRNYDRAQELASELGSDEQQFQALRGLWQFHVGQGQYDRARQLDRRLLAVAEHTGDRRLKLETHRMLGNTAFWIGDLEQARDRLRAAIELADPGREGLSLYGQDPEVANRGILAWTLCLLDEEAAGLEQAERAVERARSLAHPFTLAFAFGARMWAHVYLRQPGPAGEWAERTLELTARQEFAYLETASRVVRGWSMALCGDDAGTTAMAQAIEAWRATGTSIGMPVFLATLADAYLASGRLDEADRTLADPLLVARGASEEWLEPFVRYLRAVVLDARSSEQAPSALADAEAFAHARGARLIERHLSERRERREERRARR